MLKRILIVDDHKVFASSLKLMLSAEPDFEVVEVLHDGRLMESIMANTRPDVVVLDLSMPGTHGNDLLLRYRERYPSCCFVLLTGLTNVDILAEAIVLRPAAILLKQGEPEELIDAIRSAKPNATRLSRQVERILSKREATHGEMGRGPLTQREREVLVLIADGLSTTDIAKRLNISPGTCKKHRENLMAKLDIHSTAQLVAYAIDRGFKPFQ